jgi:hypothetical protein
VGSTINRILDRLDVSPQARRAGAAVVLLLSVLGWPVSAVTFARDEPPTVLALSWLAITLTALDVLFTADVRVQQEDSD